MRGEVPILVYCPIDTLQWGSTHSALVSTIIGAHHYWSPPEQNVQNAILVSGTLQMYKLAPMHRMHWP